MTRGRATRVTGRLGPAHRGSFGQRGVRRPGARGGGQDVDLDEYVDEALRNSACGFLLKRSRPVLLTEAVRAAVAGDTLISPSITVRLLRRLRAAERGAIPSGAHPLTARELGVAGLVAQGMTNAEIADALTITHSTAKAHEASIQRKLGVRNRVGIAAWACDAGHADPRR